MSGLTAPPPSAVERPAKKRKLRKGTQSCWECKRRKSKCIFGRSSADDATCDGCRRRGSPCVSQEYPEDPSSNRQQLGDRLGRVERLLARRLTGHTKDGVDHWSGSSHATEDTLTQSHSKHGEAGPWTDPQHLIRETEERSSSALLPIPPPIRAITAPLPTLRGEQDELSQRLLAAWPSHADLELILGTSTGSSGLFHGLILLPYADFMSQPLPSPREMLAPPSPGTHHVLMARKLLALGIYLQNLTPESVDQIRGQLSVKLTDIMARVVDAARLVTSDDGLVDTVGGVECIMMESMYHNNAGNLRRAYLAMRRALVVAQMMGLGRASGCSSRLRYLDPATRSRVSPEHMWFRIVQTDGYLSLMLGLPPGSHDEVFAQPEGLEQCLPSERLERILTLAGVRILRRNSYPSKMEESQLTEEIDKLLLKGAASMPPEWWLPPDPTPTTNEAATLEKSIRTMNQLAHYHLLQRLHLPYLLRTSADGKWDYHKMTALTASRELLSRFLTFRGAQPITGCFCRGTDFLAFIASTTLCLGHISAAMHPDDGSSAMKSLVHQRRSDRGLMERLLTTMERVRGVDPTDKIAARIAEVLQPLLNIEDHVAMGGQYEARVTAGDDEAELGCSGRLSDAGAALEIHIPHLGTIRIQRHGVPKGGGTHPVEAGGGSHSPSAGTCTEVERDGQKDVLFEGANSQETEEWQWCLAEPDQGNWDMQGVDGAFFDDLFARTDRQG